MTDQLHAKVQRILTGLALALFASAVLISQSPMSLVQLKTTAVATNSGNKDNGTLRVVLATDQVQLTNALKVDASGFTSPVSAASLPLPAGAATSANQTGAISAKGEGATGSALPSGAQYQGLNAITALPAAATAGNLTGVSGDKYGRPIFLLGTIRDLRACQTTTISASTAETTIGTAIASTFLDPYILIISNTSTATNTRVDIRDTTAGTIIFSLMSFGGQNPTGFSVPSPLPQTTVNTNWTAQAATSTTDLRVTLCYEKNK